MPHNTFATTSASQLEQALELLGYGHAQELHHKGNLLHAIQLFAGLTNNTELEAACETEIQRIRAEIAARRDGQENSSSLEVKASPVGMAVTMELIMNQALDRLSTKSKHGD